MEHPIFEIVKTSAGVTSIRNKLVNEIMHNPVGPWVEANSLYIEQSNLAGLLGLADAEPLVVYDVGLGAGANALAAIHCANSLLNRKRHLRIISFEKDLELLRFTIAHASHFEHVELYKFILQSLLEKQNWKSAQIEWYLREGNFLELVAEEPFRPHVIFFDPYSPKVNQEMWTTSCFRKLHEISRNPEDGGTCLLTYSQATRVRVSMLCAGFFVGYGQGTGLKNQTTVAATDLSLLKSPLDSVWQQRWHKSHDRYPFDSHSDEFSSIDQQVIQAMIRQQSFAKN